MNEELIERLRDLKKGDSVVALGNHNAYRMKKIHDVTNSHIKLLWDDGKTVASYNRDTGMATDDGVFFQRIRVATKDDFDFEEHKRLLAKVRNINFASLSKEQLNMILTLSTMEQI